MEATRLRQTTSRGSRPGFRAAHRTTERRHMADARGRYRFKPAGAKVRCAMGEAARGMRMGEDEGDAAAAFQAVRAGRVIQIRVRRLADVTDVERLGDAVGAALRDAGPGASICADYRSTLPLSPAVAKTWAKVMRGTNGVLARSAVLIDPRNTLFNLQMERIVRCSANPARRIFQDVDRLGDWMAGVLEESEQAAVG